MIHATRLFAASRSAAGALVRGATFSPAAPGGRVANRPFIACIWDYCTQLNLARLIMLLGNAPIVQPAEFLSSRYGWVVTNQNADATLVQSWLIEVQQSIWTRCVPVSGGCILLLGLATLLACLLACFGFARVHPPLRFPRFRWPLRGPFGWSGVCWLPLGFGLSCLFWGSPCVSPGCLLFAVGLFVPGGGRALEWFVVGAACCWRGRFLAAGAAASAAPTSLRCLFGGSSVQSLHTSPVPRGVFCNSRHQSRRE